MLISYSPLSSSIKVRASSRLSRIPSRILDIFRRIVTYDLRTFSRLWFIILDNHRTIASNLLCSGSRGITAYSHHHLVPQLTPDTLLRYMLGDSMSVEAWNN